MQQHPEELSVVSKEQNQHIRFPSCDEEQHLEVERHLDEELEEPTVKSKKLSSDEEKERTLMELEEQLELPEVKWNQHIIFLSSESSD